SSRSSLDSASPSRGFLSSVSLVCSTGRTLGASRLVKRCSELRAGADRANERGIYALLQRPEGDDDRDLEVLHVGQKVREPAQVRHVAPAQARPPCSATS